MADAYRAGGKLFGHGGAEMKMIAVLVSVSLGLAALAFPVGWAAADHVQVGPPPGVVYTTPVVVTPGPSSVTQVPGSVTVVPAPRTVVIPAPTTTVVAAPVQQILHAEQIRAHQVRANTIYANRIEADQVKGVIHHTRSVKVDAPKGEIFGSDVAASVIYADAIAANSIVADNVYVRDLELSPSRFVIGPAQGAVVRRQSP
jgi:hypothetical protein